MYVYYTIATVHAVATSNSIRLFVDIPLKAADRYFELYRVHSLPFFHKEIGKFIMIDEAFTYLAVAESRQFFALIPTYMLSRCTQDLYTVCPADMMLKSAGEPSCLTALFGENILLVRNVNALYYINPLNPYGYDRQILVTGSTVLVLLNELPYSVKIQDPLRKQRKVSNYC